MLRFINLLTFLTGKPLRAVIILYIRMIIIFSIGLYLVFVQKVAMNGIFISLALGKLFSCL